MATLILLAGTFLLGVAAVLLYDRLPTRRHQTAPAERTAERTVECAVCGKVLPVSAAVVVADTFDDADEGEMLGGTVCVVEFCPEHAPAA